MLTSMWFMSIVALLVVDVRIRALQHKDGVPHRCHHCATNGTGCSTSAISITECAGDRPFCATYSASPNFTSELTCAAAMKTPCSLTHSTDTYILICSCEDDLCNAPFAKDLQKLLLEFTSSNYNYTQNNSSEYTEVFFKLNFANITEEKLYKEITVKMAPATEKPVHNASQHTTMSTVMSTRTTIAHTAEALPRAEAFKHEPTALSEDDEDASEGSGSYEETRTQRQPASDPADPSSFLPASENKAPPLAVTFLVTTPILMYLVA